MMRQEDYEILQDEALQDLADCIYLLTDEKQRELYQEYCDNVGCDRTFEDGFDYYFWDMCEWYQLNRKGRI